MVLSNMIVSHEAWPFLKLTIFEDAYDTFTQNLAGGDAIRLGLHKAFEAMEILASPDKDLEEEIEQTDPDLDYNPSNQP